MTSFTIPSWSSQNAKPAVKPHILLKAGPENVARAETEKYIHQVWNKINAVVVKSLFGVFADDHHSDHENLEFEMWPVLKYFHDEMI